MRFSVCSRLSQERILFPFIQYLAGYKPTLLGRGWGDCLLNLLVRGPIGGILTHIDETQFSPGVDEKIAAELEQVVFLGRLDWFPASEHQPKVSAQHTGAKERGPAGAGQGEGLIGPALGVGDGRERERMAFEKPGQFLGRREADDQDVYAVFLKPGKDFLHLAEVRPTGDSGEMAKEDQK